MREFLYDRSNLRHSIRHQGSRRTQWFSWIRPPATQPETDKAVKELKGGADSMVIGLSFWPPADQTVGSAGPVALSVPQFHRDGVADAPGQFNAGGFGPAARISVQQAGAVVDALAKTGLLGRVERLRTADLPGDYGKRERAAVEVAISIQGERGYTVYLIKLDWGPRVLDCLDAIRDALDGQPRRAVDNVLARLADQREEWKKASATQPAGGPIVGELSFEKERKEFSSKDKIVLLARFRNTTDQPQVYRGGLGMANIKYSCQVQLTDGDGKTWAAEAPPLRQFDNYEDIKIPPRGSVLIGTWDLSLLSYNPGLQYRTDPEGRKSFAEIARPGMFQTIWWDGRDQELRSVRSSPIAFRVVAASTSPATQPGDATPGEGSWRAGIQAAKTPEEFRNAAAKRFAVIPARAVLPLAALKVEGALGNGWRLSDSSESPSEGLVRVSFAAQQEVLKIAGAEHVLADLYVFSTADEARKWALNGSFAGMAPDDYLLALAKKSFLGETDLGDVCFQPWKFIRGNVVVECRSEMSEESRRRVSKDLDQILVKLAPLTHAPATQPEAANPAIRKLVEQLGDPDATVRLAAIRELQVLGSEAAPALPALRAIIAQAKDAKPQDYLTYPWPDSPTPEHVHANFAIRCIEGALKRDAAARKIADTWRANLDSFTATLSITAGQPVGLYDLTLHVAPLDKPVSPRVKPTLTEISVVAASAGISKAAAARLIDYLLDSRLLMSFPPGAASEHAWLEVNPDSKDRAGIFVGWGPEMLARLDGLRKVLDGDAAKAMDELLKRLEPHRKEWEKAAPPATQPGK